MSTLDEKFFSRLTEERKRLGHSQESAGDICGVSRKMWGNYEAGRNAPGAETLVAFMKIGADITYILSGSRVRADHSALEDLATYNRGDIDLIVNAYAHTDEDGRSALVAVAKAIKKN